MTEPDGESELDRALNALKPIGVPADTTPVTTPGTDPRMAWDTVIDREPEVTPPESATARTAASSFQFDLGGAMTSKIESATVPPADPIEVPPLEMRRPAVPAPSSTTPERESLQAAHAPTVVPPLETRRPVEERMPAEQASSPPPAAAIAPPLDVRRPVQPPQPAQQPPTPVPSETARTESAALPTAPPLERRAAPDSRDQAVPRRTVFDDEASGAARAALHRVPAGSSIAEAAGVKVALPSLPAAAPATPSAVPFEPATAPAPTVSDVRAYRTAQQRAAKRGGQGRLIARMMMVIIVIGGLLGGALMFGRSYLFPTEWDPALTPIVDEIQTSRGAEFAEPIDLVVQPEAEYAATLARLNVPGGWDTQLPVWRALGIAGGTPTPETVAASIAAARPAVYDPETDSIVQLADADVATLEDSLRAALEHGFDVQRGADIGSASEGAGTVEIAGPVGFLGVRNQRQLIGESLDLALRDQPFLFLGDAATLPESADVPLPVAYDLAATDRLGPAVASASADAGVVLTPGGVYPDSVEDVFAQSLPAATATAVLGAGETLSTPAVPLSTDDWRLAIGSRLAPAQTNGMVSAITANSYGTFDRAGTPCFAAVFQFADPATAQTGVDGVAAWVAALPAGSLAVATPLDFTTVQVVGCDPGTEEQIVVDASWVDTVIDGQIDRL